MHIVKFYQYIIFPAVFCFIKVVNLFDNLCVGAVTDLVSQCPCLCILFQMGSEHHKLAVVAFLSHPLIGFSFVTDTEPMEWQERIINYTQSVADWVSDYVDIDFVIFIKWLMSPIILTFVILPW